MTPEDLISALKASVVDDNIAIYRSLFTSTSPEDATDPYFISALHFFSQLDAAQKETLFTIMRQVAIDTVSTVLGVIEGTSDHDAGPEELKLLDEEGAVLSGCLQELFLAEFE